MIGLGALKALRCQSSFTRNYYLTDTDDQVKFHEQKIINALLNL